MNEGDAVSFQGLITYREYVKLQSLLLAKWNKTYIVFPVGALLLTFFFSEQEELSSLSRFAKEYFSWLAIFIVPLAIMMYMRKRTWRNMIEIQGDVSGELNSVGIIWKTSHGLHEYTWEEILRVKHTNEMFVLFYSKNYAFYFPRSFFKTDFEWRRTLELVSGKLGPTR